VHDPANSIRIPSLLRLIALTSLALSGIVSVGATNISAKPGPHELVGFLLRQNRSAIEGALGKPFYESKGENGLEHYAYHLPESKKDYLVACYGKNNATIEMELTGNEPIGATGFLGLKLGDSAEKVDSQLGKPSEIRHEDDVNLDLWNYKDANYTLEFTESHKLYSIQIIDETKHDPDDVPGPAEVRALANAAHGHDLDRLLEMSSGEIECSTKRAYGIGHGTARSILGDQKSEISVCLSKAADAIMALGPETKSADGSIRIWPEVKRLGYVIKFPKTSPLREIVFVGEAGGWRVYEVTFR
jgi:hypothetical protein